MEKFKVVIKKSPEQMKYGGQSSYGLSLNHRGTYGNMAENPYEDIGSTIKPVPRSQANIEAEKGETAYGDFDGDKHKEHFIIPGKLHSEGGTPLNVPEGTFIYSNTKKMKMGGSILSNFGKSKSDKKKYTPAALAKQYDINKYKAILNDPNSDVLAKKTAKKMISNYEQKLAELALVQEGMKGFPQGIPEVAQSLVSKRQSQQKPQPQYGGMYQSGGFIPSYGSSAYGIPEMSRYADGGMSPDQAAMMAQQAQQQQGPPQQQMAPQQGQQGGGMDPEQIMQEVAQMLQQGAQPEEIMQQLVQMGIPEQTAEQIIVQVIQQLQGGQAQQEAPQQQGVPEEMMQEPQGQEMPPQEMMEEQPPMQRYGGAYGNVPQHGNPGVYADGTSGTSNGGQSFEYGGPYIPMDNTGENNYRSGGTTNGTYYQGTYFGQGGSYLPDYEMAYGGVYAREGSAKKGKVNDETLIVKVAEMIKQGVPPETVYQQLIEAKIPQNKAKSIVGMVIQQLQAGQQQQQIMGQQQQMDPEQEQAMMMQQQQGMMGQPGMAAGGSYIPNMADSAYVLPEFMYGNGMAYGGMYEYGDDMNYFDDGGENNNDKKPRKVKKEELADYQKKGFVRVGNTNVYRKPGTSGRDVKDIIVTPGREGSTTGGTSGSFLPGYNIPRGGSNNSGPCGNLKFTVADMNARPGCYNTFLNKQGFKDASDEEKKKGLYEMLRGKMPKYVKGTAGKTEAPVAETRRCPDGPNGEKYTVDPNDPNKCIRNFENPPEEITYDEDGPVPGTVTGGGGGNSFTGNKPRWSKPSKWAALGALMFPPKLYPPYEADANFRIPVPTFYDPARALAENSGMAKTALAGYQGPIQGYGTFGMATQMAAAENAGKILSNNQNQNVGVANPFAQLQAQIANQAEEFKAGRKTRIADKTTAGLQDIDNSNRKYVNNFFKVAIPAEIDAWKMNLINETNPGFNMSNQSGVIRGRRGMDAFNTITSGQGTGAGGSGSYEQYVAEARKLSDMKLDHNTINMLMQQKFPGFAPTSSKGNAAKNSAAEYMEMMNAAQSAYRG